MMTLSAGFSGIDSMKKRFLVLFCALALLLSMASCASPALNKSGEDYVHEKTGVSYRFASANYAAQPIGDAIAHLSRPVSGDEVALYAVEGREDERFFVTDTGRVLFDASTTLPTLDALPVSAAKLYSFEMNMAMAAIVTDADALEDIRYLCTEGVAFNANQIEPSVTKTAYEMRIFAAEEFLGVYYCLQYWRCQSDVLIYEEYTDDATADALYPGVDYTLVVEEDVTYACYNFGNALFYDPVSGQCRAAEDAFATEFTQ